MAYDVNGVLLIDAETDTIHEIEFPALAGTSRSHGLVAGLALALLGTITALVAVIVMR